MRLVLDTNTVVSGLLWGGRSGQLIDAAQAGRIEILSSTPLLAELQGVLTRKKFAGQLARRGLTVEEIFDGYAALVTMVVPASIALPIVRDPADDQVLACAISANADLIVSGDRHLHNSGGQYNGIPIVRPSEAVNIIEQRNYTSRGHVCGISE